ncbi:MAG: carboxylating nicotinate-nucleotide diphosphorylase [Thermoleophilaceae bacterium]|nr:carboxylating nicotinate-nucleotide diphosphorylase [Thermoleophilaceae bacterium]
MQELIDRALAEDLGAGDLTSAATVAEDALAKARIDQKAEGVVAGLRVAEAVFRRVDSNLRWHPHVTEGEWRGGGLVAEVAGPARAILAAERVALNFLGRLSGVATLTARYVRAVEGTGARILDTRKTTPGMRALEKQAVVAGGGASHRAGLFDAILVKENHAVLAGGVGKAARRAVEVAGDGVEVVVECATLEEVEEAIAAGAPRVLLDNMSPDELRAAAARVAGRAVIEASGGVTLDGVRELAEAGAELISVGALTHSAPALDLSLTVEPL